MNTIDVVKSKKGRYAKGKTKGNLPDIENPQKDAQEREKKDYIKSNITSLTSSRRNSFDRANFNKATFVADTASMSTTARALRTLATDEKMSTVQKQAVKKTCKKIIQECLDEVSDTGAAKMKIELGFKEIDMKED